MGLINFKEYYFIKQISITILIILLLAIKGIAQSYEFLKSDSIRARKDIVDVIFGAKRDSLYKKRDPEKQKLFFSLMPLSGSGSGLAISAVNAAFYLGDPDSTNLSSITFYPATNFESYFQFKALPNLWLNNNSWNIPGKAELAYMNQDSYGLGGNTSNESLFIINYQLTRLYLSLNKSIVNDFFLGLGYNLDYFYNVEDMSDSTYQTPFELYEFGNSPKTVSSGMALNFLFDNRKNSINALTGYYLNLSLRMNTKWLGSDCNWQSIYFDVRKYISFSHVRHRTLALWGLYWGTFGNTPYLNLPGTRLDFSNWTGRGYYKAQYIGKQMLYAEAEYRVDITKSGLWGAVVFTNFQSYTEPETARFEYILPAIGAGLRLKFNKYSDSNITFDVAVGKESYNWYFSLNEVF